MRLAIIPARGGSKGLPGKNLAKINGETLIARCVRTCKAAGLPVIVSTDHPGIASQAIEAGAEVVKRPARLCSDTATSQDAMRAILWDMPEVKEVVFAQCTSPMLTVGDINRALETLAESDLAICCVPFDGIVLNQCGKAVNFPDGFHTNRQERVLQYVVSGHCWAFRASYLEQPWLSGVVMPFVAEYPFRIDIDHQADLDLARAILEQRQEEPERSIYCGDAGALV